ncbi:universal stress protein [Spirosoma rigui]|uniref:universal stress protein n=1 Tax=Spirosoma rigui TaxID=564064 RepID=UPI0009B11645|nr:universal stress protein [Spirosoma rigui]
MKTIVAATDFSAHANQATHVAMQLARTQKATLILVHVFHFWPTNPAETGRDFPLSAQAMRTESQQALKKLAHDLHQRYGAETPIHCITKEGYAIPSIREVTADVRADLLIMSTVGTSPQSAQLMGSIATGMVAETTVPLLLIPPSAHYASIRNVVLGVDLDTPPNVVALDTALRFARQFKCVVNVLCIHDNPTDPEVHAKAEHIRRLMTPVPHTLTIQPGEDVYETLLTFAHANKADLIMMLPQPHGWFRRLFADGETERMARLTDLPLLAIV